MENTFYKKKYYKYKLKYTNQKNSNFKGGVGSNTNTNTNTNPVKAIAYFSNSSSKINGIVKFEEILPIPNQNRFFNNLNEHPEHPEHPEYPSVRVNVELEGFEPNTKHGFHVHESGDLTKGCESMCAHFNPFDKPHGGRDDIMRHVGDLGNLEANSEGKVKLEFIDNIIKLRGEYSIIGRGLIIHQGEDDCGMGENAESKITGNSGARIGCAIIGYASVN